MASPQIARGSDTLVIGLVSLAHLLSHFYQVILGPLFPLLKVEFGVSYTALGFIISLFYGVSGVCQAFVGILVDRWGGDRLMLFGIVAMASAVLLMGLAPAYWVFLPLAVLAALGNCVFHPADLSILSAKVDPGRLGRAFGLHGFGGTCGYFLSPIVVLGVASIAGWRAGLTIAALLGLGTALIVYRYRTALEIPRLAVHQGRESREPADAAFYKRLLGNRPLMAAFLYFALVASALAALQSFSVGAFIEIYSAPIYLAAAGITAYLGGTAVGILFGGELADRLRSPTIIACTSLFLAAAVMTCVGLFELPMTVNIGLLAIIGFCSGVSQPSRDILVKGAAPTGASGKTFGFVYSGLDFGGAIGPIAFGYLMDGGHHRWVFLGTAILFAIAILTVLQLSKGSQR